MKYKQNTFGRQRVEPARRRNGRLSQLAQPSRAQFFTRPSPLAPRPSRRAFTLVEMLVAVALVVLMMTLFATIFQTATGMMSTQRGVAENDQRVRLVMTILRNDLKNRTMKEVAPFAADEDLGLPSANIDNRKGYFYFAENDPDDDTDDNLQFTVSVQGTTDDLYYGAARLLLFGAAPPNIDLYGPNGPAFTGVNNQNDPSYPWYPPTSGYPQNPQGNYWQNQPEFDDQIIGIPNGAGASPAAEVTYFLRHGTLYRRVMLIRQTPVGSVDAQPREFSPTPNLLSLEPFDHTPFDRVPRNFYTYFDYSAYRNAADLLKFHEIGDLSNATGPQSPLGNPKYRFGHDIFTGLPREFIVDGAGNALYIGRFTHEETSYMSASNTEDCFGYPGKVGVPPEAPNPYTRTDLTYNTSTGKVDQFTGGVRIGEDILMTGVHRFDIKVFDEAASLGPDGRRGIGWTAGPDGILGNADDIDFDDDGDGIPNNDTERGLPSPHSDDGAFVDLGHNGQFGYYSSAALVLQQTPVYCPQNPAKPVIPGFPNRNRFYRFDTWHNQVNLNGVNNPLPELPFDRPPFRAATTGADQKPGIKNFDDDGFNGPDDAGELGWPGSDDVRLPLKAIQIHITFFDQSSQQLRDVTFVQSLVNY
ncbi:MAG: type II secretion system protein [Planctomycetaceae bacterium]|nr:type II secretion system protein [Planctomycetaceae bacterium]